MAINIATAYVQIVPSMKNVGKAITSAFGNASESVGSSEGAKLGGGLTNGLSAKFGVVTGIAQSIAGRCVDAFRGLGGEIASASDSAQKFGSTLQFAGVSEGQIKKLTASTQKYADVTVYDLNDIRNTTAQLAANGVPHYAELAEAAGNLNAVAGGNADTFKSVAMVMTQTAGAGKLTTENWNQLADAIPGASGKLQEAMRKNGAYTGDFRDAMAKGEITADEFNQAIMQLGMTDAAKEAATSTSTIEGALGNLEAAAVKAGMTVLDAVKPMVTGAMGVISDGIGAVTPVVQGAVVTMVAGIDDLWDKIRQTGAIDGLKNAWAGLVKTFQDIDWAGLLPGKDIEGVKWTVASVTADILDRVGQLLTFIGQATKTVTDFIKSFAQTGVIGTFGDLLGSVADLARDLWDAIGRVIGRVAGLSSSTSGVSAFGQTAGEAFKGVCQLVKPVVDALDELANWCAQHSGAVATAMSGIAGAFAMFKTATAIGKAVTMAKGLAAAIGGLGGASGILTAVATGFKAIVAAAGGPLTIVVTAIAAVVTALVYFFTQTDTGRRLWSSFIAWLQQAWQSISTFFVNLWNGIVQVFQDAVQSVQSAWSGVTGFFSNLWNVISAGVQAAWSAIANVFTTVGQGIQNAVATVWTAIGTLILTPIQLVQNGINNVFSWILGFITSQMESTSGVMQTAWTGIYNIVNGVWTAISTVIQTVINYMRTIIVAILDLIKGDWQGAWNTVSSFFQTTWNGIVSTVTQKANAVSNVIRSVCSAVSSWWNGIWNAISGFLSSVWNGMVNVVSNRINAVRNTISGVLNAIRGAWNSVWNGISGFLGGIWNGMVNAVGGAVGRIGGQVGRIYGLVTGALSGAGGWLYDAGRNIVQGLINGIGGAFGWLRRTITNLGSSVVGWAKSVLGIHSPSRVFRDKIGQYIPQGMALGIKDATSYAAKAMDGLNDAITARTPDITFGTCASATPTLADTRVGAWSSASSADAKASQPPLTRQDLLDCLRVVLSDGVTLHLNSRGVEVMAGKLAKPMASELEKASALGR